MLIESKKQAHSTEPSNPSAKQAPSAKKLTPSAGAEENSKWLQKFLESSVFLRLPASNLQALVARMDEVPAHQGQVIIHQGGRANNYYIVKAGSCQVLRQTQNSEHPIQLAVLQPGDGFGEDALITRGRRNASVIMLEDGCLARLSRHNFTSLLVNPVLKTVSLEQAVKRAAQGAKILDVRAPHEFRRGSQLGSINIPLPLLRANLANLDPSTEYITYCNSGALSAAAAFVLAQHGYNCLHVADGTKPPTTKQTAAPKAAQRKPKAPAAHSSPATEQTQQESSANNEQLLWTSIPLPKEFDQTKLHMIESHAELSRACTQQNSSVRCLETQEDIAWARSWEKSPTTRSAQTSARPAAAVSVPNWTSTRYTWEAIMGYGESRGARLDRKSEPENNSALNVTQRQAPTFTLSEKASAQHIAYKKVALRSLLMMRHRARIIIAILLMLTTALVAMFPDSAKLGISWAMQQIKPDQHVSMAAPNPKSSHPRREPMNTVQPKPQRVRPSTQKSHSQEQEATSASRANPNNAEADIF